MFSTADTIVAIATPAGRGAIGIVRLSGPEALRVSQSLLDRAGPLEPRRATFGHLTAGSISDHVVCTFFPAPASYTGEDVVEISTHGAAVILNAVLAAAMRNGARLAEPGEFTLRAYLNGRIDLPQAEAVADLIDAVTPLQVRAAFDQLNGTLTAAIGEIDAELFDVMARLEASVDFPEEGYHFVDPASVGDAVRSVGRRIDELLQSSTTGRLVREGVQIVIAGRPNAGKSSLFNALVGAHRAIVTDIPGTTRDLLTETVDLNGIRATLVDTAGISQSGDPIELEGIRRAREAVTAADLILLVCDASQPFDASALDDRALERKTIVVANKSDLRADWSHAGAVKTCARTGDGLDRLVSRIQVVLGGDALTDIPAVSNIRHIDLLSRARAALDRTSASMEAHGSALSEEFVLADLQEARALLEEVTGRRTADDVLAQVFERFCIGK